MLSAIGPAIFLHYEMTRYKLKASCVRSSMYISQQTMVDLSVLGILVSLTTLDEEFTGTVVPSIKRCVMEQKAGPKRPMMCEYCGRVVAI